MIILVELIFVVEMRAGETFEYARLTARIEDTSDGTEMGGFQIQCGHNGSNIQRMKIDQTEVVFNER